MALLGTDDRNGERLTLAEMAWHPPAVLARAGSADYAAPGRSAGVSNTMMRVAAWLLGTAMVLAVVVFGAQLIASETGEVVVLHTRGADGDVATRLWVVDHDGRPWLRSGTGPEARWYARLQAEPRVELVRDGVGRRYRARAVPAMAPHINASMAAKYGWRDNLVGLLVGGRGDAVAIELIPDED